MANHTNDPLLDDEKFNLELVHHSQTTGRPLFGQATLTHCTLAAQKMQQGKKVGFLQRIMGGGQVKLPEQDALIKWVETGQGTPPTISADSLQALSSARYSTQFNRATLSAFHPHAAQDADAARRFGQFLTMIITRPAPAGLANVSAVDAMLALRPTWERIGAISFTQKQYTQAHRRSLGIPLPYLAAIAEQSEYETLVSLIDLIAQPRSGGYGLPLNAPGFRDAFITNAEALARYAQANAERQTLVLNAALRLGCLAELEIFALTVLRLAASSKVKERKKAEPYIAELPRANLRAAAETVAAEVSPTGRIALCEMLETKRTEDARSLFPIWAKTEPNARVRTALEDAIARLNLSSPTAQDHDAESYTAIDGTIVTLPDLPPEAPTPPVDPAVITPLREAVASYNEAIIAVNEQKRINARDYSARVGKPIEPKLIPAIDEEAIAETMRIIRGEGRSKTADGKHFKRAAHDTLTNAHRYSWDTVKYASHLLTAFFDQPALHWQHLTRICAASHSHSLPYSSAEDRFTPTGALWRRILGGIHLREVLRALPGNMAAESRWRADLSQYGYDDLWMVFVPRLPGIIEKLSSSVRKDGHKGRQVADAMTMLAHFPALPRQAAPDLLRIALGPERSWRLMAQNLLGATAEITPQIIAKLSDGKADMRVEAALWLGRRGDATVMPALEKQLKKEKTESARAALMTAIQALGGDLSSWLNAKALQAEAEKALTKLKLDKIEWLLPLLPADLKWANGKPVSPEILRYWVALAVKLKQPGGNGLFALWLDQMDPDSAGRLGQLVITTWILRDTTPMDEASARAKAQADLPNTPRYYLPEAVQNGSPEMALEYLTRQNMKIMGGATDCKGILGLGMRAHGAETATAARAFLKKHGERVSQAKAVVEAMAANPAPAAIQVVIGVAERFRQKSVMKRARELVDGIAETNGWTADELADRTIPRAGFDDRGSMQIDAGRGRVFTAQLTAVSQITLTNPDGKTVKALPAPAGTDGEKAIGAAAKKLLSAAKKEVKEVTEQLTERLFEAMCLERSWPMADWQDHLQNHPLAGLLCQRAVWAGYDDQGAALGLFRPMDDGTLTDVEDNEVAPAPVSNIRLAHGGLMTEAERAAWSAHFNDYEVTVLFSQFDSPVAIDPSALTSTEINDRLGWVLETFALRSQTKKRGYERGPILDAGGFNSYVKFFRGAGLVVEVNFSGSMVPEENMDCALLSTHVRKLRGDNYGPALPLQDIPPALLSAVRNDLIIFAQAGRGFDEDYQKYGW